MVPQVWVDTTGWAFPYPLVRMAGGSVAAYVHYPTISTDMLGRVRDRTATFNNDMDVAGSAAKSGLKLAYYQLFALVYGFVGSFANVVMVNSSWTKRHVASLWGHRQGRPLLVYPPADTAALQALPLDRRLKRVYIISVAQFRPEKDHKMQLRAFAAARAVAARCGDPTAADAMASARLQLVGGCRGPDDEARLEELKKIAYEELGLGPDSVEFRVNVSFEELRDLLGDAIAGLHSMVDEHFGISVVEYMAAGAVPIANNSGGPREDIVVPEAVVGLGRSRSPSSEFERVSAREKQHQASTRRNSGGGALTISSPTALRSASQQQQLQQRTGFLCSTVEQYTDAIVEVVKMDQVARLQMAAAARRQAAAFSDERFKEGFMKAMEPVLPRVVDVDERNRDD